MEFEDSSPPTERLDDAAGYVHSVSDVEEVDQGTASSVSEDEIVEFISRLDGALSTQSDGGINRD